VGYYEDGNKVSVSIKCEQFLDYVMECEFWDFHGDEYSGRSLLCCDAV